MPWNRHLWGVEFTGSDHHSMILGSLWRKEKAVPYPDEPTRALLFCTRSAARKWCHEQMEIYSGRSDCCADWKYRPIRVSEIVRKIGR